MNNHIRGIKQQREILKKFIYKARFTEFGQENSFGQIIKSYNIENEYKTKVNLYDYDTMYSEWWYKYEIKNRNITWPGKVKYFALSSGTSGASSKYIPVTTDQLNSLKKNAFNLYLNICFNDFKFINLFKDWLCIGGSSTLKYENNYYIGDLSGIILKKTPFWAKYFRRKNKSISTLKSWKDRVDKTINESTSWDTNYIFGNPAWVKLTLENIIKKNNAKNIHDIWPNLELFIGGGVSFDPYKQSFLKLLGKEIKFLDTYLASEGFIGYQKKVTDEGMTLLTNSGIYYEFIPYTAKKTGSNGILMESTKTLNLNEIKANEEYALVITTSGGAWRYLIGDIIKFINIEKLLIKITGRISHNLNICGEHISLDNIIETITRINIKYDLAIENFTVAPIDDEGYYGHHWFLDTSNKSLLENICKAIDSELKKLNDDYKIMREAILARPKVSFVKKELFFKWLEHKNKLNGQSKFPKVIKGKVYRDWLNFINLHNNF